MNPSFDIQLFLLAIIGGAIRISTPYLFVSLGETITEKSGLVNLGQEGNLILGAMAGYGVSYLSGSAWAGVAAAAITGGMLGAFHGWICGFPRVNDIAMGIAIFLFGVGLAFFIGKPFIQPTAPRIGDVSLAFFSDSEQVRQALKVNFLFLAGIALAFFLSWFFRSTRYGLLIRAAGEHAEAATSMGYHVRTLRIAASSAGGALAGIGGAYLSLYYPGSWNEGLSSGQGLMAVALVIFARWEPRQCVMASLIFGGAVAIGPALQSMGFSSGYYLINAAPYIMTLILIMLTSSGKRSFVNAPAELSITR